MRVATVGDIHVGVERDHRLAEDLARVGEDADVLLLAGDLTRHGTDEEGATLAEVLSGVPVPMVAVLGNHDLHNGTPEAIVARLEGVGVCVLEGSSTVVQHGACRVGVAGTIGFGGGFVGACASDFGEPEMKAFVHRTQRCADQLRESLERLEPECDVRIALLHYAPVADTLRGEPLEIFPFLGSYLLAEAVDSAGADLVVHGHAHRGSERGTTPGGIRVRNVARPLIRSSYRLFGFGDPDPVAAAADAAAAPATAT